VRYAVLARVVAGSAAAAAPAACSPGLQVALRGQARAALRPTLGGRLSRSQQMRPTSSMLGW